MAPSARNRASGGARPSATEQRGAGADCDMLRHSMRCAGKHLARAARVLSLLLFVLLGAGCNVHLLGMQDDELVFAAGAPSGVSRGIVEVTRARLAAARIAADVTFSQGSLRVVVDADATEAATSLLLWRGGLTAHRLPPAPAPTEPWDVTRATAIGDFPDALESIDRADGGRSLRLRFDARSAARLERLRKEGPVVFSRGGTPLRTPRFEGGGTFVIPCGDELAAYARAERLGRLLSTPTLPALQRSSVARLATRPALATACLVLPFLLSLGWLLFVRLFDRAEPEPWWLVLCTFGLGALSAVPAGYVEHTLGRVSPYLNPSYAPLGGQLVGLLPALIVFTVVVGGVEEGAKYLGATLLATRRREFDEPVDGIVYGAASALGFAAVENIAYFEGGRLSGTVVTVRAFVTVPVHFFFAAIWGYALGQVLVGRRRRMLLFALAALAHGAFDTFLSIDGLSSLSTLLALVLGWVFVRLLRSALRHGVVEASAKGALAPARRVLFTMGSRGPFLVSAIAMIVCAAALTVLGGFYESAARRVGYGFVAAASAFLVLFAIAAYRLTTTMPLDAVIDERGLTFGGVTRAWSSIRAAHVVATRGRLGSRFGLHIDSRAGDLHVGPTDAETARLLSELLHDRVLAEEARSVRSGSPDP